MKTIMIVIAGMADLPDPVTLRDTPLAKANIPALDMLAQRGDMTAFTPLGENFEVSHKNALLSVLGYDLQRGEPSTEELMEFGLDKSRQLTDFPSLRPFVIPGFSGHGVAITTSAWVRGVAKCAMLKISDIYSPGSSDIDILETITTLTTNAILQNEFVLVYVDSPLKTSLRGNYDEKIRNLEIIDRHLISGVADFVWKSDLMIQLAITTDLVTPWHRRRPNRISIPSIVYFNNHDWDGDPEIHFTEVQAMLRNRFMTSPSDLIRYLCNFNVSEEES